MVKLEVVNNSLYITNGLTKLNVISTSIVGLDSVRLYSEVPTVMFYNNNVGVNEVLFESPLSNLVDRNSEAFTKDSFLLFYGENFGVASYNSKRTPIPTNVDRIYASDIDLVNSDNYGFSGSVIDYVDNLQTVNKDSSLNNPKTIKIWFNSSQQLSTFGLGCNSLIGDFSNVVLKIFGSNEVVRAVFDDSLNDTKYNTLTIDVEPSKANGVIIEFHTVDEVCLSNFVIWKSNNVNARVQGIKEDGTIGDLSITNRGNAKVSVQEYGDTPSIDAFDRLRVSNPYTLYDSKQLHDKQPLFWDENIGGSATSVHLSNDACTRMSVTANALDYVVRQTKQRFNYQPGKSQLIFCTYQGIQKLGLVKRVGLFDGTGVNYLTPNNGIFFETDGVLSWNICKNGVITETIIQENWNVDKLDGKGVSGLTFDPNSAQILVIDFEWLGVGRVRVGWVIDGLIIYVHYFNHANDPSFPTVYMSTPNLPIRYSIQTDGTNGDTFDHICSTVISEGGVEETGVLTSVNNGIVHIDANASGVTYALLGIRLKTAYKDITVTPVSVSTLTLTNDNYLWSLRLNPTIAGAFTFVDVVNSSTQLAIGVTANTVIGGTVISSGYVSKGSSDNADLKTALRMGADIEGVTDRLILCVTPLTSNADLLGSLTFRESL